MAGLKGIFESTHESDDETAAAPRPTMSRRGLGQLLDEPQTPTSRSSTGPPAAVVESNTTTDTANKSATSAQSITSGRKRAAEVAERPPLVARKKTSLTLPGSVRARTADAYERRRWTFAELVDEGLRRLREGVIGEQVVERILATFARTDTTSTKTVQLANDVLEELDDYAGRWRLSRSQLVAVMLADVTDSLG